MSKAKPEKLRKLTADDILAMAAATPPELQSCNVPLTPKQEADAIASSSRWRAAKAGVTGSPESSLKRVELQLCRRYGVPLQTLGNMPGYETLEYMEAAAGPEQSPGGSGTSTEPSDPPKQPSPAPKNPKRSTERDEARTKIIAALTKHHQYANGSCKNLTPIGCNALAHKVGVADSSASDFFKKQFKGHAKYRAACTDTSRLVAALKLLNNEFSPYLLLENVQSVEARRGGEGQPDDE